MDVQGPERFRFAEMDPGDFEELCFLLARLETPEVRRLRAPDGGLDAAIFAPRGVAALRGWQAKRRRQIDWGDLEASLAAALARHRVQRVTFCFSTDLTADQRQRFAERLQAANPAVELDYWDAGELTARLLSPGAEAVRGRYFRRQGRRPPPPLNRERLPLLTEASWQEMGVTRGALLADEEGWTAKLDRGVDLELAERLRDWGSSGEPGTRFVVLSGPSGSGKTRALLDALRKSLPSTTLLLAPQDAGEAREIADGWHRLPEDDDRPVVLWLDDLERFLRLDETGLTRGAVQQLIGRDRGLLIAATCHGKGLSLLPPDQRQIDSLLDTLVDSAGLHLRLAHRLSKEELGAIAESGRIEAAALAEIDQIGIGPYVLGIERLRDKLARDSSPHHEALVEAALDWAACGIGDPVEREALRVLWQRRLAGEPSEDLFRDSLDWAQEPVVGRVALIARAGEAYTPSLLLAEEHRDELDEETVATVLDLAGEVQAEQLALAASGSPAAEAAIEAFAEAASGAKVGAVAGAFAVSLISTGQGEKGVEWLRRAAAEGDVQGTRNLGIAMFRKGKMGESLAAFERADAMGDAVAANGLAAQLSNQGRDDEALEAFRRADARGDADGTYNLAWALEARGERDEAREAFRRAVERGQADAATALGTLVGNEGDHEGALELFRVADQRGDREGSRNLGHGLERIGDRAGARAAFERADERGDAEGALRLGLMLLDEDIDAALLALNRADVRGSADGSDVLGQALNQLGLLDYAEHAYRRADERGSGIGAAHLGTLLEYWDADDEAEEAYRRADERGEPLGTELLGMLLQRREDPGAREVLERADARGSAEAALALGGSYASEGDLRAAEGALRRALDRGSAEAGRILGELYLFEGLGKRGQRERLAEEALRRSDELGSAEGAFLLACFLEARGRDPDAVAAALRRADERGSSQAALMLGEMHQKAGELDLALACFGRAEEREEPQGACGAANVYSELGMSQESNEALRRALAGGVEDVAIHLAEVLASESDFKAGLEMLEEAVDRGIEGAERALTEMRAFIEEQERELRGADDPDSRFQMAVLLHRLDRLDEAIEAYETAADGGDAEAGVQMGNILSERGELERAIAAYRRAVDRGSGKAAFLLGFKLTELGDEEGARKAWARADELGDGGGACQFGTALAEAGETEAAEGAYRRAVEYGHGHAARMHADLLRSRGELDAAAERLRRAVELEEEGASVELGRVLLTAGDGEGAREAFAAADNRGEAAGAFELGQMLLQMRRVPEAVAALRRAEARGHEKAMFLLTQTLALIGRSRDAEQVARRWHARGSVLGSAQLVGMLVFRGEYDVVGILDQVLSVTASDNGGFRYFRGLVQLLAGRPDASLPDLALAAEAEVEGARLVADYAGLLASMSGDGAGDDGAFEKRAMALYECGNPFVARDLGERARAEGDLDLAEEALRKAFAHGGQDVGEELASLLDELQEPDAAREVRERARHLSIYDDPLLRPMQGVVQATLGATGLQWLHAETVQRGLGFAPS